MMSSWKSAGAFALFALSIFSVALGGSGVEVFTRSFRLGLRLGLICLGARWGGGNSCSAGPAMASAGRSRLGEPKITVMNHSVSG